MNIEELQFVVGTGNYEDKKACILSAAVLKWRIEHGEPIGEASDQLECVCPVIRKFFIRLNDSRLFKNTEERTKLLMPFVDKILNTKGSKELTLKRAFRCADFGVRTILLEIENRFPANIVERLKALKPIVDKETAIEGRDVARAAYASAYAAASAYASAYAAADASADAAAAAAADAAAAAAAYAKNKKRVRILELCLEFGASLCEMKE